MKVFKAEQWNIEILLPLFEEYRLANGMSENPDRTLAFLTNRIRFNESMLFIAVNAEQQAVGFIQLFPRLSSLLLQRYWQLTDIFVSPTENQEEIYTALLAKAKEFASYTQAQRLVVEEESKPLRQILEQEGFKTNPQKSIFELNLH